jgi:hypothetical protein
MEGDNVWGSRTYRPHGYSARNSTLDRQGPQNTGLADKLTWTASQERYADTRAQARRRGDQAGMRTQRVGARVASGVGGLTDARAGGYRCFAEEKWSLVWSGVCDALGQLHDLSDL